MAANTINAKQLESGLVLRGLITLAFGVAAVFWPHITLVTLLYLFSAYVVAIGIITAVEGVSDIGKGEWWFLRVILGLFELGVGIYLLRHIHVTFTTLILLIGFALIARGLVSIVSAFMEEPIANSRVMSIILGLLGLVIGIIILFQPVASGVAFVWLLGLYALIAGPLEIALAIQIRDELKKA